MSEGFIVTFETLHLYNYLSYANFASYALLLTLGVKDPFLGEPVDPSQVRARINLINNEIITIINNKRRVGSPRLNKCFSSGSRKKSRLISTPQDYQLRDDDFDRNDVDINTNCFMEFEVKEYTRVFGGRGIELRNFGKTNAAIAKLALLGSELTWVGKVFGGDEVYFLFLDIDPSVRNGVYPRVRDFFRRISNGLADEVSQVAKIIAPAGIILMSLYSAHQDVKEVINNGVIMHLVSNNGDTVFDLTRIMDAMWRLGLAGHINILASNIDPRNTLVIDLLNKVSQAVYETVNTGNLLPVYEYTRYVISAIKDGEIKDDLASSIMNSLTILEGLRWV